MKKELLNKLLLSGKVKMVSFFAGLLLTTMPAFSNAATVSFGVTFGNPQSNGGVCVGKGVCRESLGDASGSPEAVNVSFGTSETNPSILTMTFSMSELTEKQPDKVSGFTDPMGYSFDAPYMLSKPQFGPLHLLPGAMVAPGTRYTVMITGDNVTVYIPYAHTDM
ncbi:MAG: hypothetical protein JWQ38_1307 [Flavipsychrobacter sp.]|nr:hypothetical protein [Flavipsychrobacter sp.]